MIRNILYKIRQNQYVAYILAFIYSYLARFICKIYVLLLVICYLKNKISLAYKIIFNDCKIL